MNFKSFPASYLKPDPETEERALRDQADALKAEMEYINNRLDESDNIASFIREVEYTGQKVDAYPGKVRQLISTYDDLLASLERASHYLDAFLSKKYSTIIGAQLSREHFLNKALDHYQ